MAIKFVGPFAWDFKGLWLGNIGLSGPKGTSKSAFVNFHGNRTEFWNSDFGRLLFDFCRLYVPNFVTMGWEMAKKLSDEKGTFRWKCVFSPNVRGCLAPSSKCVYFVCGCTFCPLSLDILRLGKKQLFKLLSDNGHLPYAKSWWDRPIFLGVDMEQT